MADTPYAAERPLANGQTRIDFQTDPSRYRHWQLRIDGDAAIGREIEKALREIDVICGKRLADFALGNGLTEHAVEGPVAHLRRIIGGGKLLDLIQGATSDRDGGAAEHDRGNERDRRMAQLLDQLHCPHSRNPRLPDAPTECSQFAAFSY